MSNPPHSHVTCSPHPPLRGHGADVPPAPLQTPAGLLDGVVLCVSAGVGVVQQEVAERQHGRHGVGVLLDVPLELLGDTGQRTSGLKTRRLFLTTVCCPFGQRWPLGVVMATTESLKPPSFSF